MTVDELLREFPEPSRRHVREAWEALPETARSRLEAAVQALPAGLGRWKSLVDLAFAHVRLAAGGKGKVAIVGPANVGKSTLYNQLLRAGEDRAEVSPVPGTTRTNQEADAGLFTVVDTPGADAVGEVGQREKEIALAAAREADILVVMFDAIQGIKRDEQALFAELAGLEKPFVVALNKIDLVERHADRVVRQAAKSLGIEPEQVVPCSARDGKNVDRILLAIAKAEPGMVAALGQALPAYRRKLARQATRGAATTAAAIALAPLPIVDVVPLLAVQASLVLGIARIYDQKITLRRARELVATFGLAILGRTLFQELSRLGGPPGWLLAAAIASSTTAVMGYAAAVWFERGERLTRDALGRITKTVTGHMLESLRGLGRRRPDRRTLEEKVESALDAAALPERAAAEAEPPQPRTTSR
jgi:small GTP-binding protein